MGTRAYWLSYRWRYRMDPDDGWTYAETLADVKEDVGEEWAEVQQRTGRKSEGYTYVTHSTLNEEA